MATIETRKSAKGITCRVKVRLDGKPPVTKTFTRLAPAKVWGAAIETAQRNGQYNGDNGWTVADTVDGFIAAAFGHKDTRMLTDRGLWWRGQLGKIRLRDLNADQITRQLDLLLTGIGGQQRQRWCGIDRSPLAGNGEPLSCGDLGSADLGDQTNKLPG